MHRVMPACFLATAYLCCAYLPVAQAGSDAVNSGWEQIDDSGGIIVYEKDPSDVPTVSLKGEADIAWPLPDILAVMKDNRIANEWMPMVVEKHDIAPISTNERLEYMHIGMPWPLTDRYFINRAKAEYLPDGVVRLSVQSIPHPDPRYLESDKVLGTLNLSVLYLVPTSAGHTHVSIEVNTDPKGLIPKWIANMVQRQWPRQFFEGLRRQLAKTARLSTEAPLAH